MASRTVTLDLRGMKERFRFLGDAFGATVLNAALVSSEAMLADVVKTRMSNPRRGSTATNLGVDTGTARRSMENRTNSTKGVIEIAIGSPLGYVAAHERGFNGVVQVPGHVRRLVRLNRNAKTGLVTKASSRRYKQAVRQGRKTTVYVRPHGAHLRIAAKHFISDTVEKHAEPTAARIERALMQAALTGRVPTRSDIAGGFRA